MSLIIKLLSTFSIGNRFKNETLCFSYEHHYVTHPAGKGALYILMQNILYAQTQFSNSY